MNNTFENINLVLLNIGYSELNANWNWKDVYSPFSRIYYVKEGSAKTYINNRIYTLEPGFLYLTPPFTLHQDECDGPFCLYYIHFFERVIRQESIFDKYDFPVKIKAVKEDEMLVERLKEINPDRYLTHIDPHIYDNQPTFSQSVARNNTLPFHLFIESQGILSILMSRFMEFRNRKATDKDERIVRSLKYIHTNINTNISLCELASLTCVSEDHFIRLFKKELNRTPIKYINEKKIEKAQLLLISSDLSIREIAMELAIDNISYFNKIFKQLTGKTPLEYKKSVLVG